MSCCGRARPVIRESNTAAANGAPPVATVVSPRFRTSAPQSPTAVWLRYTGESSVRVRGPVTGRDYFFSDRHLIQRIDAGDAAVLVRTPVFRRTW